jgi:hypothetical protein
VTLPARAGFDEEEEEVVCDTAFLNCITFAVGPVAGNCNMSFIEMIDML